MSVHPRAGTPARPEDLIDLDALLAAYRDVHPGPAVVAQRVAFGTSGHRGSSLAAGFNDDHIAATSQAICEYRAAAGTRGPLFLGRDTHALSEPAWVTAVEVFAANDVAVLVDSRGGYTPTPAVSRAILKHNAGPGERADGAVVTPSHMSPNHFLAVAIDYLYAHRPGWPHGAAVGKTAVSSSMIDRVAEGLGRRLLEVPVGFKWFVPGLLDGAVGFGGEESAGASFLRKDGTVWTTGKDGPIMSLLAAEIVAVTGETPSERYRELTGRHGDPIHARIDVATTREAKARLGALSSDDVTAAELAGDRITAKLTAAPGNGAPLGGLKVVTGSGWFAARPSGTEDVYKIYAESFAGPEHLAAVQDEARRLVDSVLIDSSGGAA